MALTGSEHARLSPFAGALERIKNWLADKSDSSLAQRVAGGAFIIRVASAALVYICQILLARWMGSFEFGIYVYVWTWVLLIGGIAPLGLAYLAQRFIPEYTARGDDAGLRGFILGSRWICFGLGVVAAALGAFAIFALGERVASYYVLPFMLAFVCLPIFAVSSAQDSIARSYNWIDLALLPAYIAQPILILMFMAAVHFAGWPAGAVCALFAAMLAMWSMTLMQLALLRKRLAKHVAPGPRRYEPARWMRAALPIFLTDGFFFLLTYIDILLLKIFVGPEQIAIYYAASKTLALVAFVYFAVAAASAHRFAEYNAAGEHERLADFAAAATRWTFWPSLAMALVLIVFGKWILMLFGPGFDAGYPLIVVLACGLLARASIGPAERLLNMVGQQRACALVYAAALVTNVALCLVLVPHLGLTGAALATASALVVESALLFVVARKRLGLHIFIWRSAQSG